MFSSISVHTELTLLYQKGTNTTLSVPFKQQKQQGEKWHPVSAQHLTDDTYSVGAIRSETPAVRMEPQVFCRKNPGSPRVGPTPRHRALYHSLAPREHLTPPLQKMAGDHFVFQSINDVVTSDPPTVAGLLILLKSYDRNICLSDQQIS